MLAPFSTPPGYRRLAENEKCALTAAHVAAICPVLRIARTRKKSRGILLESLKKRVSGIPETLVAGASSASTGSSG
jgi:hypothetical protein